MSIKQNGGVFGRNPTFNDVTIEGQLTFEGNIDIDSDITWEDGKKALFGDSGDLEIYHDGSNSRVQESGTGSLLLRGTNLKLQDSDGYDYVACEDGGGEGGTVKLKHNNQQVFATSSIGVNVTGTVTADDEVKVTAASGFGRMEVGGPDGAFVDLKSPDSDDYDLRIKTTGTGGEIDTAAGEFVIKRGSSTKLSTSSGGVDVTGDIAVSGNIITDGLVHKDDSNTYVKFLPDRIYMDVGGQRRIDAEVNSTKIVNEDTIKLQTGSSITDGLVINASQNVSIPNGDLTVDGAITATTSANTAQLTLISTDTDANVGPRLDLYRNSSSPANGDLIGEIQFQGEDSVGSTNVFATISSKADQVDNGAEDGSLRFKTLINGSLDERFVIAADGNVSIPNGSLAVSSTSPTITIEDSDATSTFNKIEFQNANGGLNLNTRQSNGTFVSTDYQMGKNASGAIEHKWNTNGQEALKLDSSQNVSIPNGSLTVGAGSATSGVTVTGASNIGQVNIGKTYSGGTSAVNFRHNNGLVGQIYYDNTSTAYITSSDYRLKEDVQAMSGATDRLKELKPVNFAWKADGSRVDGFLAHEAQEVVPESVTGSKDAMMTEEYEVSPATGDIYTPEVVAVEGVEAVEYVAPQDEVLDENGNVVTEAVAEVMAVEAVEAVEGVAEVIHSADVEQPSELEDGQLWRETTAQVMGEREVPDYQGIDQAKLVPLLVATIQELEARITALES